jgi:hypothetical protein
MLLNVPGIISNPYQGTGLSPNFTRFLKYNMKTLYHVLEFDVFADQAFKLQAPFGCWIRPPGWVLPLQMARLIKYAQSASASIEFLLPLSCLRHTLCTAL